MAASKGITRYLYLIFDRKSAKDTSAQMESTLQTAGKRAGDAWFKELKAAYAKAKAELKEQWAAGKIGADQYKQSLADLDRAYNKNLISNIQKARAEGKLTDQQYLKLSRTLKDVGVAGDKSASLLQIGFGKVAGFLAGGAMLLGLKNFVRGAVSGAIAAEEPWNRLKGTLSNVGIEFKDVESKLRALGDQTRRTTRYDDEQYAEALQELISISRDYQGSIDNMSVVLNLAAEKQMDLGTAATLVGKAMVGETGTLARYGIVVKDASKAMEALREQFRGAAENDAQTLGGRIDRLGNAWSEFRDNIGGGILNMLNASGALEGLIGNLEESGRVMQNMARDILKLRFAIAWVRRDPRALGAIAGQLAELQPGRGPLRADEQTDLNRLEPAAIPGITVSAKDARDQAEREREKAAERAAQEREQEAARIGDYRRRADEIAFANQRLPVPGVLPSQTVQFATPEMLADNEKAAEDFVNPWHKGLKELQENFLEAGGLVEQLALAWADGGIRGLARFAGVMAKEAFARAIGATARGIMALADPVAAALKGENAAMHFDAAVKFGAEAAAWGAVSAMGGGGGGSGGGAAVGLGGAGNAGGATAQRATEVGPEIHVHFEGAGFSAVNPVVQRVVVGAMQEQQQRAGPNATIRIHRRSS